MKTYWQCFGEVWQGIDGILGTLILSVMGISLIAVRQDAGSVTSFAAGLIAIAIMVFALPLVKCLDTFGQRPKVSSEPSPGLSSADIK